MRNWDYCLTHFLSNSYYFAYFRSSIRLHYKKILYCAISFISHITALVNDIPRKLYKSVFIQSFKTSLCIIKFEVEKSLWNQKFFRLVFDINVSRMQLYKLALVGTLYKKLRWLKYNGHRNLGILEDMLLMKYSWKIQKKVSNDSKLYS